MTLNTVVVTIKIGCSGHLQRSCISHCLIKLSELQYLAYSTIFDACLELWDLTDLFIEILIEMCQTVCSMLKPCNCLIHR